MKKDKFIKFWVTKMTDGYGKRHYSYEDAVKEANEWVNKYYHDVIIYEAVSVVHIRGIEVDAELKELG